MIPYNLDRVGVCTSTLCAVHCMVTPLLIVFSGSGPLLGLLGSPLLENGILLLTGIVGLISFVPGYRKHHQSHVMVLFGAGLLMILGGTWSGAMWVNVTLSVSGAGILVYSHLQNQKLIRALK